MKYPTILFICVFVVFFGSLSCSKKKSTSVQESPVQEVSVKEKRLAQTKKLGKQFVSSLQKELQKAIKEKGLPGAIKACSIVSPNIEKGFTQKDTSIIKVRRISLKTRNAKDHTPTPQEASWLLKQETAKGPGFIDSKDKLTVLLPIRISKDICLKCHGNKDSFSKELTKTLAKYYPNDKATGYKLNDLRGALSVEWKK